MILSWSLVGPGTEWISCCIFFEFVCGRSVWWMKPIYHCEKKAHCKFPLSNLCDQSSWLRLKIVFYGEFAIARSEQAINSVSPLFLVWHDKTACGSLGLSCRHSKVDREKYDSWGSYEVLMNNGVHQRNETDLFNIYFSNLVKFHTILFLPFLKISRIHFLERQGSWHFLPQLTNQFYQYHFLKKSLISALLDDVL